MDNMLNYRESFAVAPQLKPYIESYMHISGDSAIPSKSILPRPGTTLSFDFSGKYYNDDTFLKTALSGFHERPYRISSTNDSTDCVVVKFTAFGLSRFTSMPMSELTNQVVDAVNIFGHELHSFYHQLKEAPNRIPLLEDFLLKYFKTPSQIDTAIFTATSLQDIPLSIRQTERRFKHLVGVDLQTYIRICRFDKAKTLLLHKNPTRLTDVAYDANYFDQAHFSNEFKRLTGVRPGKYNACGDAMFADAKPKDVVLIQF
ncbi:helix-turn-helix domain-containing protein [Chitinophaga sp. SYP-B3965]|uniref:helix-turn-helix domain-containing protein n=1 Tax=Chitinophaga sp. SYP-B3965 TaxID=2663120 RepID=UPI001563201F|nr:helix-turn-helix domain-containing protein [Chitinophaga sp. SYP-B3965]